MLFLELGRVLERQNLEADIPSWDFDGVRRRAAQLWDAALGKVEIQGGTPEQTVIFRTAMYHAMIDPRDASDVTGEHPSGDGKTRIDKAFTYRTIFSGWDVFRSQFPLQTLINPKVVNDEINSLIQLADTSGKGYLERWEFLKLAEFGLHVVGKPALAKPFHPLPSAYSTVGDSEDCPCNMPMTWSGPPANGTAIRPRDTSRETFLRRWSTGLTIGGTS